MKKIPLTILIVMSICFMSTPVNAETSDSETRTVSLYAYDNNFYTVKIPVQVIAEYGPNTYSIEAGGNVDNTALHIETADTISLVSNNSINKCELSISRSSKKTGRQKLNVENRSEETVQLRIPFTVYLEDEQ